jgi:type III secretion protein I
MIESGLATFTSVRMDEIVDVAMPSAMPSTSDQARFELAMLEAPRALDPAFAAPQTSPTPLVVDNPASLGDRILASVDQMRTGYQETMQRIDTQIQAEPSPETRMQNMMEMFVDITRLSLQQEVLGKLAGKATQNLDTLLKAQ